MCDVLRAVAVGLGAFVRFVAALTGRCRVAGLEVAVTRGWGGCGSGVSHVSHAVVRRRVRFARPGHPVGVMGCGG